MTEGRDEQDEVETSRDSEKSMNLMQSMERKKDWKNHWNSTIEVNERQTEKW